MSVGVQSGLLPRPDLSARPDLPPKPDHLRIWQCTQSDPKQNQNEDECEYLEPVPRHDYEEPGDSTIQTDRGEEQEDKNHYEPIGGMKQLE